ncbi:alpha/beta hydrolase [Quadrisphaera sp. INWT6]|uniref:alpha/beta hydrolase n=1 Tax=Quadrisphaera sp. INWT6 TaxID=2596917 RepID=UPI0018925EA7|nr:alpha/beta hydrolase [Quadrisphaera sp. INWT6]MBF5080752.1 alpha/beta hydrolase [Quadrisphaera sp. INWT6]
MRVVFVHGACVRDGAWWWESTGDLLAASGVRSAAVLLPSCGETGAPVDGVGPGLPDDVAALREELARGGGDDQDGVVVVAHSYGGIVAAEAVAGMASVAHLVLVSSYLPLPGESLSSFGGPEPAPFLDVDAASGTFGVRPEQLLPTFLHDCPEAAPHAAGRLARQSLAVLGHPVQAAGWQEVATTYLVCTQDRGTPADAQRRFAERADRVVDVAAGHHPFISQPRAVADLVLGRR